MVEHMGTVMEEEIMATAMIMVTVMAEKEREGVRLCRVFSSTSWLTHWAVLG